LHIEDIHGEHEEQAEEAAKEHESFLKPENCTEYRLAIRFLRTSSWAEHSHPEVARVKKHNCPAQMMVKTPGKCADRYVRAKDAAASPLYVDTRALQVAHLPASATSDLVHYRQGP
jgi:hypothetical protein